MVENYHLLSLKYEKILKEFKVILQTKQNNKKEHTV